MRTPCEAKPEMESFASVSCEAKARISSVGSGFTVRIDIDLTGVDDDEPLFEAGPLRVAIRMAGKDGRLLQYDMDAGNYLNFPMPGGSCPVLEATTEALRVGIPIGLLERPDGIHGVTVNLADTHLSLSVDGHVDDDMFKSPTVVADFTAQRALSVRVKSVTVAVPADADALGVVTDSRPIGESIQYWTPAGHDAWVGDVAPCVFDGRLHVFYLFDRRHHGSKQGAGGHRFAHVSSHDLASWSEHPTAVPITEWWETLGTGTPFAKDGRLCLAYGLHTDRITKDAGYPIGGTYAESEDGIHFAKSGAIITKAQNPSVYNRPDGGYELVESYGGNGLFRSDDLLDWKLCDGDLPFAGDCPSLFDWHGHRYLLQGFSHIAYSADGSPGSFVDWTNETDVAYDGLCVPMVVPWNGDRRLYIGWLRHPAGWGGWLVFRELVAYPDGHLGMKWVPEIRPPVPAMSFRVGEGRHFVRRFVSEGDAPALVLDVDPVKREATFADDVPDPQFDLPWKADNLRIGGLRCVDGAYEVKVVVWYDRKADTTVFDAEIGGGRTMICRRRGRFKTDMP